MGKTTSQTIERVKLMGMPGSPYTRKMLGVLRYRHIAYEYRVGMPAMHTSPDLPKPKVSLLPTFYLPNSAGEMEALVDSTPLIRRLEADYPARSVIPTDPVVAFINDLIEDYADEWLTKAMFHYRWDRPADIKRSAAILPLWLQLDMDDETHKVAGEEFAERQINRLYVVGSNKTTAPVIETSYQRFLDILSSLLLDQPFVMGSRPGSADFALYGQLTALSHFDPTPMAEALNRAPRAYAWVDLMDDQSGCQPTENGWWQRRAMPTSVNALLSEIGRVYVPAMLANAKALIAGAELVETEIDGKPWQQKPFPYQGKCVQWLNDSYAKLSETDRSDLDSLLAGSGCEQLFAVA